MSLTCLHVIPIYVDIEEKMKEISISEFQTRNPQDSKAEILSSML